MKAQQNIHRTLTKIMIVIVSTVLCGLPELAQAQQQDPQQQQQSGTTVDPSKGPLQPIPTQNQPATDTQSQQPAESSTESLPATPAPQPRAEQQMQQPLGAGTAEGVPTVGGAASRPAGMAIAPDKQRQRRSLLIKLGLLAAAGVAVGTVAALSQGTSAKPSGAK